MAAKPGSFDLSRLVTREATLEDYDGVCAIDDNIYQGLDYLPGMYKDYLKDPNRYLILAELEGQIVAFHLMLVVDEGTTGFMMAGRLIPSIRSFGIWHHFEKHSNVLALKRFPNIRRIAGITINKPLYLKRMKFRQGMHFLMDRARMLFEAIDGERREINIPHLSTDLYKPTKADSMQFLQNIENQWRLFPHGRIITRWESYRLMDSNFKRLLNYGNELVVTLDHKGDRAQYGPECRALSFNALRPIPLGFSYTADFYGDSEEDAISHALYHIRQVSRISKETKKCVYLMLVLPGILDRWAIQEKMRLQYNFVSRIGINALGEYPVELPETESHL